MHHEVLTFIFSNLFLKAVLIPRELREILCPPLTYHKHVSFSVLSEILEVSLANLVDGLLWITPHAETLSIEWPNINFYELSFQVQYIFNFIEVKT